MNVIEVRHLTKDYGSKRGVFDVSLDVGKGEVFGFLGPNGAGKSTTIRHLMGFSRPDEGETLIFGKPTFKKYYEILGKVGYIPGEIALPAGLTGREFIKMMQVMQGQENKAQLDKLLEMFELSDEELSGDTKRMSLGVKRKLAVVTAFMHDPEVLILDEPTSGLDPVMQDVFVRYVRSEKERGKTVLLSSHIFSEVDATCDRIAIIKDGRIVDRFVANDLKHASTKYYTITFASEENAKVFASRIGKLGTAKLQNCDGATVKLSLDDCDLNGMIELISDLGVRAFGNRGESLEDHFMKFYKEDGDFGGALK